jgi:hypothetical protein
MGLQHCICFCLRVKINSDKIHHTRSMTSCTGVSPSQAIVHIAVYVRQHRH